MVKALTILLVFVLVSDAQVFLMNRRLRDGRVSCDTINDAFLKAYWKLNEASGNAIDDKGANDLTDINTVGTAAGILDTARDFTAASNEYLSIADNADIAGGDVVIFVWAWVRHGALTPATTPGIMSKWPGGGDNEISLYADGDAQRYGFAVSGNGSDTITVTANSFGDPADEVWHLVMAWHDPVLNTINIQVDGGTVDSTSHSAGVHDGAGAFTLGAIGTSFTWTGQLDEAGWATRIWTSGERVAFYNYGLACRATGL